MRQLTSLDAQFLSVETSRTYGHVGGLAVYDPSTAPGGQMEIGDVCRLVGERLHLLPVFRWRLAQVPFNLDLPYWVDDPDFDIDFHIRESAVPPPGDDGKLAETVARIFARPLDRARPLWELYLIQGVEGGRVALLTKIHHAVVDGVSGSEILSILLDPSPEGREIPPPPPEADGGERPPGDLQMLARGLLGLPRQPLRAVKALPTTLPNVTELPGANALPGMPTLTRALTGVRRALGSDEDPNVLEVTTARPPRTCFNGPISAHRRFAFGSLSLDTVRRIKNELGVRVNDVVVALCAGALRGWLEERDELPDDPLVAMVPVSVRTTEERGTFGNRVSMMVVPIPTNESNPGRRVQRTHEYLRRAKERHRALPANLLTDATRFIPPAVMALAARTTVDVLGRTRPPVNVVISNVPGPREPLYCAGAQLQAHYPVSVVVDGVGLNITVMSYRDHLDFGIVADREQVDDVWSLLAGAGRALDELKSLVGGSKRPRVTRSPAGAGR
ncbi:MAG: wax ester/triacylglycerol synthase family O-acyltransferase [Thermoleophilaceae bacterium]|nr:wax ester/triacylglycerol synthase family O-acyltransferase [Thermoleophilaceae bacterium]